MSENKPSVSRGRKFSGVWIIPLVAVAIGAWMVIHTAMTEGPTITIEFKTAEGLEAGKTKVRILSHEIGLVEDVVLKADVSGVIATVKLEPEARPLLREDTRFWVVRARVGAGGVSGLGTLLSGAYIEMAPGSAAAKRKAFVGLEEPPLTPVGAPGLRLTLFSDRAGSTGTGNAVLYRGYKVGRVEATAFDTKRKQVRYDIFIDAPFHELVHSGTRFWDISGISVNASADGIKVKTGSVETILLGGVSFGTPPGVGAQNPVADHAEFTLYGSYEEILENPYQHGAHYVVSFRQSLRGLVPGAPVEYRGILVGRVERVLVKELAAQGLKGDDDPIPVLIYLEPGRLEIPDSEDSVVALRSSIEQGVRRGMRATLQTGNLLTGRQLIGVDYYPDEEPAELGQFEQYATIPTIETGVDRLETQVSKLLKKLNALPLEETVAGANKAMVTADDALASLKTALDSTDALLSSSGTQAVPDELVATLQKASFVLDGFSRNAELYKNLNASLRSLDATLNNTKTLTRQLSDKPNSLLLPASNEPDPIPRAKNQ
ncbi:MAG: intermembrane transport protein PqiB [Sedimenticolaceae bacterium]